MEFVWSMHLFNKKPLTKIYIMKNSTILLVSLFCLLFCQANAETIKGKVSDAISGKPINTALLVLVKSGKEIKSLKSNTEGLFSFTQVDPGTYSIKVNAKGYKLLTREGIQVKSNQTPIINMQLSPLPQLEEVEVDVKEMELKIVEEDVIFHEIRSPSIISQSNRNAKHKMSGVYAPFGTYSSGDANFIQHNTESYDVINENIFKEVLNSPLSTFSVDVDKASYSNIRRFINQNQKPPKDAVRIEEMVNYFDYDYPQPPNDDPFSINFESGECPWNKSHDLVLIGIQGKEIKTENIPPSNLVFLIDVSGSMSAHNKLPLLKQAFKILVGNLRPQDRVAMVVYAGAAGLVLESTSGNYKTRIIGALDNLNAGGSTAGGAGIKLAYKIAKQHYIPKGNNRIILATDGDFNVGASSNGEMVRLIEEKRKEGVFLSVLGFGMGNYKDSKMETISNAGNGNYAYIDNILEAQKVFGKEMWGTLYTIAKDVKIQVEFNPAKVKAYRLIGYENRILNKEDFNDDKKDAGDIGSGHTVTALYEIIPAGSEEEVSNIDPLTYQQTNILTSGNLMTVKLRYKKPDEEISTKIVRTVKEKELRRGTMSNNFSFAASVAEFGMLLRDSEHKANASYEQALSLAKSAKGADEYGYRQEFIKLLKTAQLLAK